MSSARRALRSAPESRPQADPAGKNQRHSGTPSSRLLQACTLTAAALRPSPRPGLAWRSLAPGWELRATALPPAVLPLSGPALPARASSGLPG